MDKLLAKDFDSEEEDDDYVPDAKQAKKAEEELQKQNVGVKRGSSTAAGQKVEDDDIDDLWAMMNEDDGFGKNKKQKVEPAKPSGVK